MWQPIETAPDYDLVLLLFNKSSAIATEDEDTWRSIGFCEPIEGGIREWFVAGWEWCQDQFVDGRQLNLQPAMWQPLPKKPEKE